MVDVTPKPMIYRSESNLCCENVFTHQVYLTHLWISMLEVSIWLNLPNMHSSLQFSHLVSTSSAHNVKQNVVCKMLSWNQAQHSAEIVLLVYGPSCFDFLAQTFLTNDWSKHCHMVSVDIVRFTWNVLCVNQIKPRAKRKFSSWFVTKQTNPGNAPKKGS